MARSHTGIAIVGGGVIGVCCAYFLAKRGAPVVVLERDDIGKGASYGNAGTIAPGHPPINKPGRVRQALESLFDPVGPLYIPPRWDPALLRWLWEFRTMCTPAHLNYCVRSLAPLGHATSSLFDRLVSEERLDCGYRQDGYYEVFATKGGLEAAKGEAGLVREHGYHPEILTGGALREREPALNTNVLGGVFHSEAATVNPYRFVMELAERARRNGATFRTGAAVSEVVAHGSRVRAVRLQDGESIATECVVLATGAYSSELVRKLGVRLPLQAGKGYHRDREPREGITPALQHTVMLGESSVFCTPMKGFVRFAGTLEFSGINHEVRRPRLEHLTKAADRYLNGMGEAPARSEWCGLRPCLPDGLPVVGAVPGYLGLFVATGHAMLGLTLGPVTGKLIAELVLDGEPTMDIRALRVDRF